MNSPPSNTMDMVLITGMAQGVTSVATHLLETAGYHFFPDLPTQLVDRQ